MSIFSAGPPSLGGWLREVRGGPAENMLKQARRRGRTDKPAPFMIKSPVGVDSVSLCGIGSGFTHSVVASGADVTSEVKVSTKPYDYRPFWVTLMINM